MVQIGNPVEVWKGTHKGKAGMVIKMHRVYISIRFSDGSSEGKTLPSSVKVIDQSTIPIVEEEQEAKTKHDVPDRTRDLESFRAKSIALITEMMAQGMALSDHSDQELEQKFDRFEGTYSRNSQLPMKQ
jgi:hypothetical protein